jgi:hypothetical protein
MMSFPLLEYGNISLTRARGLWFAARHITV